jgi:hypothetical protein
MLKFSRLTNVACELLIVKSFRALGVRTTHVPETVVSVRDIVLAPVIHLRFVLNHSSLIVQLPKLCSKSDFEIKLATRNN